MKFTPNEQLQIGGLLGGCDLRLGILTSHYCFFEFFVSSLLLSLSLSLSSPLRECGESGVNVLA